jgi:outer membrane protein OmpA-like peptidoglycan-associated protein
MLKSLAWLLFIAGAALSIAGTAAVAGDNVTADQIVKALQPKPLTRSISTAPPLDPTVAATQTRFVASLRNRRTRSLSTVEREEIANFATDRPKIDLEITFDYNSAEISTTSLASVQALGKALSNPNLKGSTFLVAGHTDSLGGESYNQDLSERRADTIKRYLVERFGIASADLVTVGYGKSKPKDSNASLDPANRRVQVVNMASKSASN